MTKILNHLQSRLHRVREVFQIFGLHRLTWLTVWPPFRGWDVGCGYCDNEQEALKTGHCECEGEAAK